MQWNAYPITEQLHIPEFYSFFDVHYEKDYSFAGESHDFWECLYVIDGSLRVSADDRVYELTDHHIIFHKPLELHKFHVDNDAGTTLLIFSFALEGSLSDALKDKVFRLNDYQQGLLKTMLRYLGSTLKDCTQVSDVPELKYLVHERATGLYFQMLTTYIYQLLLSLVDSGFVSEVSNAPDVQIFGKAVSYINNHLNRQVSMTELAEHCHVSLSTLKRVFQKYAGISVHKYILALKIKTATELLKNGMHVTTVSEALGFGSQAYFSACYKRETGLSPTDIQKNK